MTMAIDVKKIPPELGILEVLFITTDFKKVDWTKIIRGWNSTSLIINK